MKTKGILKTEKDSLASWPSLSSSARASFKSRRNYQTHMQVLNFPKASSPSPPVAQLAHPTGESEVQSTAGLCNQQPRCGWDSGLLQLPLSSPRAYGLHFTLELYSSNIPVPNPDRPHPNHHPSPAASENTWRLKFQSQLSHTMLCHQWEKFYLLWALIDMC